MRHADWQSRFWAELERARTRQWQWGVHDCVSFGARMADVISDSDYILLKARFAWKDARDVARLLRDTDLITLVAGVLGTPMDRRFARHGDLVMSVDTTGQQVLAVHDGVQLLVAAEVGFTAVATSYGRAAWRID